MGEGSRMGEGPKMGEGPRMGEGSRIGKGPMAESSFFRLPIASMAFSHLSKDILLVNTHRLSVAQ